MGGFVRRFSSNVPLEQILAIEGVVIIDSSPPGTVAGTGSGTVNAVGEAADCTYAVLMSATGLATSSPRPVEVFSGQDLIDKVGGFDETLGQFGTALGSLFCAVRNKRFTRLVCSPVDIVTPIGGTQGGVRVWRDLPTNASATDPSPITPVSSARIEAGLEFKSSTNRVRLAQHVTFSDALPLTTGTDGAYTTTGAAATQTFTSASSDFTALGTVQVGDILTSGIIGTSLTGNAATRRITAVGTTTLTIQAMDGTNFAVTTEASLPWRVTPASAADSAGSVSAAHVALASTSGSTVIARPLDASILAATVLTPTVVPSAGTATSWDPLSGLQAYTRPTAVTGGNSLIYDANVHAPNAANNSTMDTRYGAAMDATVDDDEPAASINLVYSARHSDTIRAKIKSHVLDASANGLTRTGNISPQLSTVSLSTVLGNTAPGVGATRAERVNYCWPGAIMLVPEAIGFSIATADGKTTTTGILDDTTDGWLAAVESNLPPENNPGQSADPVPQIMAPIAGFQRGSLPRLRLAEYISLKAYGVVALRFDKEAGPIFQSGITSSLTSGLKTIARRRMADFIQDSLADAISKFVKLVKTQSAKDDITATMDAFMANLLSVDNPPAQRIAAYSLDARSGNTPATDAAGVFVVITRARTLGSLDDIVLSSSIGDTVDVSEVPSTAA